MFLITECKIYEYIYIYFHENDFMIPRVLKVVIVNYISSLVHVRKLQFSSDELLTAINKLYQYYDA